MTIYKIPNFHIMSSHPKNFLSIQIPKSGREIRAKSVHSNHASFVRLDTRNAQMMILIDQIFYIQYVEVRKLYFRKDFLIDL
jgi:hypothetical protein